MVKLMMAIEELTFEVIDYGRVSQSETSCGEQCSKSSLGQLIARCKFMVCTRTEGGLHGEVDALDPPADNARVNEAAWRNSLPIHERWNEGHRTAHLSVRTET